MNRRRDLLVALSAGTLVAPLYALVQTPAASSLSGTLTLSGSSTMTPLIKTLAEQFRQLYPGANISVEAGGSNSGLAALVAGKCDIAMMSRELKSTEKALFAIPIARDGVVFAVNRANPVAGLTKAQLIDIFSGKVTNWKAVGGIDATITVVTRPETNSSIGIVSEYLGIAPASIKSSASIGDNPKAIKFIAETRDVLAFLSTGAVEDAVEKKLPVKPLKLDNKLPGSGSIRDGSWPLSRPLNLVTRNVPSGLAQEFIKFVLSPKSKAAILDHDFVPYIA